MRSRAFPSSEARVVLSGLAFPESPRWCDGRLWVCNWGAQEIVAVDPEGGSEVSCPRRRRPSRSAWIGCTMAAC